MSIYYIMVEAKPFASNPESESVGGAYISCWVNSENESEALEELKLYMNEEKWEILKIEDIFLADRERYEDNLESLECFYQAVEEGLSVIFHIWPIDAEDAYEDKQ